MAIFHPVDETHKTIIHLMKYPYQAHESIYLGQTNGSNV
jgi:hypothetical protein